GPEQGQAVGKATGTDGSAPSSFPSAFRPAFFPGEVSCDSVTMHDRISREHPEALRRHNPLNLQAVASGCEGANAIGGKLPGQDSNLDKESQTLLCYRYTTG